MHQSAGTVLNKQAPNFRLASSNARKSWIGAAELQQEGDESEAREEGLRHSGKDAAGSDLIALAFEKMIFLHSIIDDA
jgi:hypothetical protein